MSKDVLSFYCSRQNEHSNSGVGVPKKNTFIITPTTFPQNRDYEVYSTKRLFSCKFMEAPLFREKKSSNSCLNCWEKSHRAERNFCSSKGPFFRRFYGQSNQGNLFLATLLMLPWEEKHNLFFLVLFLPRRQFCVRFESCISLSHLDSFFQHLSLGWRERSKFCGEITMKFGNGSSPRVSPLFF